MKVYDAKTSFAGGELSPALYARVDLAQYQTGARTLQNFIVMPQGSIINRPGTERAGTKSYSSVKLIPFIFSEDDCRVLVFYNGAVDVYSGVTLQVTIPSSPYSTQHLKKLRWLQSGDVLYLFHPNVPVYTLSRTGGTWVFKQVEFEKGPFEDVNTDPDKTLRFNLINRSEAMFRMRSSFNMSELIASGMLVYVETEIKSYSAQLEIPKDDWVTVKNVFGAFTYRTFGSWWGAVEVQRCRPDGWQDKDESAWEWEDFKTYRTYEDAKENFDFSGDVEEYADHYRFRYSEGGNPYVQLAFNYEGGTISRVFKIHGVESSTSATAFDVDKNTGAVPNTDAWAFGSFNSKYGYPSVGIFHQERLVLAGTPHSPQSIWMSQSASWHDFSTSIPAKDDDAISVTLASKEINEIRGLASRGDLLIFTAGGEWTAKAGSKTDVFTPSSIVITPAGYRGSAGIPPLEVGDVTLFMQRQATTVRSIGYSLDVDGYSSQDISILSEHIFNDNPVQAWSYQQTPWSVVWCVLQDGTCATVTLQKEHQVTAWTRQVFANGKIKDVCCIPGGDQDYVYFAVERSGNIQIERLKKRSNTGSVFLDAGNNKIYSIFESLDWEIRDGHGTIQGRHKFIPAMTIRLSNTQSLKGCIITEQNASSPVLDELQFPGASSPGTSAAPFSGDVRLFPPGGVSRTCRVRLENNAAYPVTILGFFPEVVLYEEDVSDDYATID